MNERNILLGAFYFALFLLISPIILGGIFPLLYWARTEEWIPFWILYSTGLIITAIVFSPLIPKMYIINKAYHVSFHLDPFFGNGDSQLLEGADELKQLVDRGPGFHFLGFWEEYDSHTEHELEFKVPLEGTFETLEDNVNFKVSDGLMILKAPMSSARALRSIAQGMTKIRDEIEAQLKPTLKLSAASEFVKYKSEDILRNQFKISDDISKLFDQKATTKSRYGLVEQSFVLGDINFSEKINNAREAAKAAKLRSDAAKQIMEDTKDSDGKSTIEGKDALDFVLASEDKAKVTIDKNVWEIRGVTPEVAETVKQVAVAMKGGQALVQKFKGK